MRLQVREQVLDGNYFSHEIIDNVEELSKIIELMNKEKIPYEIYVFQNDNDNEGLKVVFNDHKVDNEVEVLDDNQF